MVKHALVLILALPFLQKAASADAVYQVTFDTSPLIGNAAAPFSLDFQLNDGSGTNDGNNTVTLSNFNFGTGKALGTPATSGGATGALTSQITLTDNSFLNEFTQEFQPGAKLTFTVKLTGNVDAGGTPDEFSAALLDNLDDEVPALGNGGAILVSDINSATPSLYGYASDPNQTDPAVGKYISFAAPNVTSPTPTVPEPSGLALVGALVLFGWSRVRKVGSKRR